MLEERKVPKGCLYMDYNAKVYFPGERIGLGHYTVCAVPASLSEILDIGVVVEALKKIFEMRGGDRLPKVPATVAYIDHRLMRVSFPGERFGGEFYGMVWLPPILMEAATKDRTVLEFVKEIATTGNYDGSETVEVK